MWPPFESTVPTPVRSPEPHTSVDLSPVSSRCSVRLIHDVVSDFSTQQIELVKSIGFEGLLHLPYIKQINLRLSTWLMSRVDERAQTLTISDGSRIHLDKRDVARVFGIPVSGTSIFSRSHNATVCSSGDALPERPLDTKHLRSIKAAQGIVSRQHAGPMTSLEQDEFRAAFVVLVMSTLLAPSAKHDRVPDDYLHTLQHPRLIGSYDWSEYVLRRLLDAVSKLKADMANNVKVPYMHGCSLFLQVLYLDSIDLGLLSMEHNVLPRIRCFTADRLRSMIAADASFSSNGSALFDSRRIKLRPPAGICYHWANRQPPNNVELNNDPWMLELWEVSVSMARVLKFPPESAGPLFTAVSDFQRQLRSTHGTEAVGLLKVISRIMEPYANGFSYLSSTNVNLQPVELCGTGMEPERYSSECCCHVRRNKSKRPLHLSICPGESDFAGGGLPKKLLQSTYCRSIVAGEVGSSAPASSLCNSTNVAHVSPSLDYDMMAIIAMSRFYLTIRPVKTTRCSDLNAAPRAKSLAPTLLGHNGGIAHVTPRSPWELGCCYIIDPMKASDILRKLSLVEDADEPWIVHFCPKYIEVITCAFKAQFSGLAEFEMELFDAVIRRYKQIDDELYLKEGSARWRHFVESDFMSSLLAGWFDIADPVVRSQFCGRHISYDVTAC